ncbi:S8 family serine peptidase [Gelidibacter maritimus]|uniref:S8 family serine peptidase n=1 Tax=Gelidibacter maritimus TaxID=2761487 RepID=A0A7W2M4W7_9FLAO|nr:S8 family serine peptidase [Gelidibacter maritimus]MBA6152748.1 S8 family serine peptidase [Gelidibacter maritimus]
MKVNVFLFLILCVSHVVFAQQDAWVYLMDKENVEASIQNPISILTQQAIIRKNTHQIPIDARDVPVNESYISLLKSANGISVLAKSKWMNAVHVRGEVSDITALFDLEFVSSIQFANKNLASLARPTVQNEKFSVETGLEDFHYGSTQNQVDMIHVDALHLKNYTGEGIVIAVIDAGFPNVNTMAAFSRLRSNNRLLGGYDFVDRTSAIYDYTGSSHGTKVLSTMAGYIENEFVGTAPDASYYLFRTEDAAFENPVEESYWVEAAERADSLGVHIINSSLGYNTFDNANYNYTPSDMNGTTAFISKGANIASEKGILVVNSAGNSGNKPWGIVTAPADASGVFTVGAVNDAGLYVSFSSKGNSSQTTQKPDVVAQGLGAMVVDEMDAVVANNGTSLSSPILAGGIACLWQALPNANAEQIKQYVRLSASQYTAPDYFIGYGIPNFQLAFSLALSVPGNEVREFKIYPNPVSNRLHIQMPTSREEGILRIYDALGKLISEQVYSNAPSNIDVSYLNSGLYMLHIISNSKSLNFKFIKS